MAEAVVAVAENLGSPLPIRLSRIERFEGQPRVYFNKASIESLADSIQSEGLQQPIKVTTKPGSPGMFILVDGERRTRAFALIHERTGKEPVINAFIEVISNLKEHFRKSTIANLHREDLAPLDTAAAFHRLRKDGETIENLAALVGKSTSYVDNYLRIYKLPDEVKALMDPNLPKEQQLTVTQAIDIARGIPESAHELRIKVATEAVQRNLSTAETRSLVEYRTGVNGHRVGGRFRKPSDDYKVFTSFLGRTRSRLRLFLEELDIDGLYEHRDNEKQDRRNDLMQINAIIAYLEQIRDTVNKN